MACGGAALLVAVTIATVVTLGGGRTAGAGAGGPGTIAALEAAEHIDALLLKNWGSFSIKKCHAGQLSTARPYF